MYFRPNRMQETLFLLRVFHRLTILLFVLHYYCINLVRFQLTLKNFPMLLGQMLLSRIYYSFLRQDLQDFQDSMNYLLLQISFLFLKNLSWNSNLNLFCLLNFFFCYLQILDYQNFLYFLYYPYHPIRLLSFVFVLFWFHLLPQNY